MKSGYSDSPSGPIVDGIAAKRPERVTLCGRLVDVVPLIDLRIVELLHYES